MTQVLVQLAHDSAVGLDSAQLQAPFDRAKKLGLELRAVHPGSQDPALSRWFVGEVENEKAAELVKKLHEAPEFTAAYVKPRAEAP